MPVPNAPSPLKRTRISPLSTGEAFEKGGRTQPCICGCGVDCQEQYTVPFPAGSQGRDKMLRLFSLHVKLASDSYNQLLMSEHPRLSLLHFSRHQLQLQTHGQSAGKRFTKLRPPQCWDEGLLQRKQDVEQLLFRDAKETGVPTRNDEIVDPESLSLSEQVAHFKALAAKRLDEAQGWKLRAHQAETKEEARRAELVRTVNLLENIESDAQTLLRELKS